MYHPNGKFSNILKTESAMAEWMNRSPVHATELRNLSTLWGTVDQTIDEAIAEFSPSKIKGFGFFANILRVKPAYAVTATIMIVLGLATINLMSLESHDDNTIGGQYVSQTPLVINVDKGDRLTQTLQDGSIIHMNTDSVVEVNYTNDT